MPVHSAVLAEDVLFCTEEWPQVCFPAKRSTLCAPIERDSIGGRRVRQAREFQEFGRRSCPRMGIHVTLKQEIQAGNERFHRM